ncbi:MAG: hypothetical protein HY301_16025 [Verrucomicrobia bacterium]|nr:hypothetical protein [Verrucomicrobiota bacterium]
MPATLDPAIAAKLTALGHRWRRLVLLRGLCAILVVGVGSLIALALLDRLVVMPDWLRIALTLGAYAATVVLFWLLGGRYLLHAPDRHTLARVIERAEPKLREELLSAIELGEKESRWDSPVFRSLVQQSAAAHLREVKPAAVLPRKLIRVWLIAAPVVAVVCFALLSVERLQFPQLLLRAAAPMLDLERVSTFRIAVLTPAPGELVPRGDTLTVNVAVAGGAPKDVTLEFFRAGRRPERVAMAPSGSENQFAAALPVEDGRMEFRVRAGDAQTRRFRVDSRPRPQVLTFEKKFSYPEYTKLAAKTVTENNGDLVALEGTLVDLALDVDQPVKRAELRLNIAGNQPLIPLNVGAGHRLTARVPLTAAGIYRVYLVACDTGFENKFGSEYELRPQPDLVPQVELTQPKENLIAAADDVIEIRGSAKDDFGLASVLQLVKVNTNAWQEILLGTPTNAEFAVARAWNLFEHGLRAGDQVSTKLAAVDIKGNRSESLPVQVLITATGFDANRLKALDARRRLLKSVTALAQAVRDLDTPQGNKRAPELLRQSLAQLPAVADKAWLDLKIATRMVRPGREAADLALAGQALAQIRALLSADANFGSADKDAPAPDMERTLKSLRRIHDLAWPAEATFRDLLGAEEADVAFEKLRDTQTSLTRLGERAARLNPQTAGAAGEIERRKTAIAAELKSIEPMLKAMEPNLPGNFASQARRMRDTFAKQREALVPPEVKGRQRAPAPVPLANIQKVVDGAARELSNLKNETSVRADRVRASLNKANSATLTRLDDLQRKLDSLARSKDADTVRRTEARDLWRGLAQELRFRAELEEVRPDADSGFVADLAKASQMMQSAPAPQRDATDPATGAATVKELFTSLRALEASHQFQEIIGSVRALAEQERWEPFVPVAVTARPRDWRWAEGVMQAAPAALRQAGVPPEGPAHLEEVSHGPLVREIAGEMTERSKTPSHDRPMPEKFEALLAELSRAAAKIQNALNAAREAVAQNAPKLSEQMESLAKVAEAMEKQTREQEAAMAAQEEAKAKTENAKLSAEQSEFVKAVEELRDALRREANQQSLATKEGRDKARDADDASAMLREPPRKADDFLREAAAAPKAEAKDSLTAAADQQKKTADTLKQLAKHFKNAEMGQSELTRADLRQAEAEMGLKEQMDARDKQAELLAELSKMSQDEQMKKLEEELKQSQPMQRELSSIAKNAVKMAAGELQQAAMDEKNLSAKVRTDAANEEQKKSEPAKNLAQSAQQQTTVNGEVDDAAEALQRAMRHEQRIQPDQPNPVQKLADGVQKLSAETLPPVQKEVANAPNSAAVKEPVQEAQRAIETSAAMLKAALGEGAAEAMAQKPSGQQDQKPGDNKDPNAQQLARALDRLDAAKNQQQQQQGKPSQQSQQSQQSASQQQMDSMMAQAKDQQKKDRTDEKLRETPGTGADSFYTTKADAAGALPNLPAGAAGQWGKLPPQMASQLLEGSRESVSGEYRAMVETYFRVIADKARAAKP